MSFAKLEFFNPFSRSIKDRTVFNMLFSAIDRGDFNGGWLFEATSGNVGIAMAAISNVLGLNFRAYLPKPTPKATVAILKTLGAEVVLTDFETIDEEMIEFVKREAEKAGAVNLNQYENDENFLAHYRRTAGEIEEQLESVGRKPDVLIAGIGTSGHIAGIGSYLKERYGTRVVGVIPAEGERIPGIKRLETGPKWVETVDEVVEVSLEDAVKGVREVAKRDGLLVGLSSGAVYSAMRAIEPAGTAVLIFPDDSFKYIEVLENYVGW